jgi:hypothetical protein
VNIEKISGYSAPISSDETDVIIEGAFPLLKKSQAVVDVAASRPTSGARFCIGRQPGTGGWNGSNRLPAIGLIDCRFYDSATGKVFFAATRTLYSGTGIRGEGNWGYPTCEGIGNSERMGNRSLAATARTLLDAPRVLYTENKGLGSGSSGRIRTYNPPNWL